MDTDSRFPFSGFHSSSIFNRYHWPASWIILPEVESPPYVLGFRLIVDLAKETRTKFFVTADERYELLLDGKPVARGSERGSPDAWYYETLELAIPAGRHVLFARVWAMGDKAPVAQFSVRPGFLLAAEDAGGRVDTMWSTGHAPWEVKKLEGYDWKDHPNLGFHEFTGKRTILDGRRYPWGVEMGEGKDWIPAAINSRASVAHPTDLEPLRLLIPGTLPPMLRQTVRAGQVRFIEELTSLDKISDRAVDKANHQADLAASVQGLIDRKSSLLIPRGKKYRAIIDLENYYCAYPRVTASGGKDARLSIGWAEALFERPPADGYEGEKGNRDEIENRRFIGFGDSFIFDGQTDREYSTLWWGTGRYLQLMIETGEQDLVLNSLELEETRYPLEMESSFSADDPRYQNLVPILLRTLQMNAHETFMDCPYYEQLNYTGDTLIDCLVVYAISNDLRLVRKSLQLFNDSRLPDGLSQSRFPCRSRQFIPPFSLLWVSMTRNHAWWRGERKFIRSLLPGVRAVLDAHLARLNSDGLLPGFRAWNFLDWVPAWDAGVPPGGEAEQVNGSFNWLLIYALQAAIELEDYAGEPELSARYSRVARALAAATDSVFWNENRGLYADDAGHRSFSEHAQCLAILSGWAREDHAERSAQGLLSAPDLHRCTIYFTHYLFETFQKLRLARAFSDRLDYWFGLPERGFVTILEKPEPSRSDCHAWGSHPLHHFYSTVLGIRPASIGFDEVTIAPLLGSLEKVSGKMVHPKGWIEMELQRKGPSLRGTVTLPPGVTGRFIGERLEQKLSGGRQQIDC
jgi:alpha-L-rhamnosidase